MARVISSQYMQMDLRPFNARISSSINQNPFSEDFSGKVVVIPQNAGGHRTYIAFKNGLELILKFEYIECSEPGAYFHIHIVVAIGVLSPWRVNRRDIRLLYDASEQPVRQYQRALRQSNPS